VHIFVEYFIFGGSALLPLINPPGSALELLSVVGFQPETVYRSLARKIAVNTIIFLAIFGIGGTYNLRFFGISLSILQLAGGLVVAALGWSLLNQRTSEQVEKSDELKNIPSSEIQESWDSRAFYPLTFPLTAGPGGVAVMLTLSAQARALSWPGELPAFAGLMLSVLFLSIMVYFCYAYAPQLARRISRSTVCGVLRLIAFSLLCIGCEIAWRGLQPLLVETIRAAK
jgi:multiple antibiotic resistance protein